MLVSRPVVLGGLLLQLQPGMRISIPDNQSFSWQGCNRDCQKAPHNSMGDLK